MVYDHVTTIGLRIHLREGLTLYHKLTAYGLSLILTLIHTYLETLAALIFLT